MSKFHSLPVARVERETRDAVAITFAVPEALRAQFRFEQGQHLTLRADVGGEDVRRSYSICSAVQDGTLRIAVKKSPGGVFSTWANTLLKAGDTIDVMPPLGHFNVPLSPRPRRHYLGFAAGSGITPLLSIVKTTLAAEPRSRFTLVYGNRASGTVMFKEELAGLKDTYLGRFNLVHVLSREAQDIELLHGRIDRAKADALLAQVDPLGRHRHRVRLRPGRHDGRRHRGPEGARVFRRQDQGRALCREHSEARARRAEAARARAYGMRGDGGLDGVTHTFLLEKAKENILEAGLRNGVELPYSCKGGVCSTCRCRLVDGEVDMDVNFALEDYEVARGFILACQSYPVTDKVTIDYDQTGN